MISALIVDDQEAVARTLMSYLEMEGYHAWAVENGNAALASLEKSTPSVVFLDLMLPDMDGIALLSKIKNNNSATKVIAMSGDETLLERASSSSDAVLAKPLKSVEIKKALEKAAVII